MTFNFRNIMFAVVVGLALFLGVSGCGDQQSPTAPTPPPIATAPDPVVQVPLDPPAKEPFCPYRVVDNLEATRKQGTKVELSWDVTFADDGKTYLKRYQAEIRGENKAYEIEIKTLGGRNGTKATAEIYPLTFGADVRIRAHYPDECRGPDGSRANTPWNEWQVIK